jgi:glutamyl-tRNA reductase
LLGGRSPLHLFVAGFSYNRTPLRLREKYYLLPENIAHLLAEARQCAPLTELVVLNTCNRFEVYAVSTRHTLPPQEFMNHLFRMIWPEMTASDFGELTRGTYLFENEACVRHLFRTASGLDSMIVGEAEVLGQVKDAYHAAHALDATGAVLNRLFQNAFSAAKRVRTESDIGRGFVSIGTVAVHAAAELIGGEEAARRVVVCGVGQMGRTVARQLKKKTRYEVTLANRTLARAEVLAAELGFAASSLDNLDEHLAAADAAITALSVPDVVINPALARRAIERRESGRPLALIDISLPRAVDPAVRQVPGIHLIDLDELGEMVRANEEKRQARLAEADRIVDECLAEHLPRLLFALGLGPAPEPAVPIRPAAVP